MKSKLLTDMDVGICEEVRKKRRLNMEEAG